LSSHTEAPRIYNLFPLLAGPVARWRDHLDRVARMHFNWIYLNPIQYPGFSGSLYSIKDPFAYHPLLGDAPREQIEAEVRRFISEAERRGLRVMIDLVINHTSKDALLVDEHPEWYVRDEDGSLKSPSAIDPADARRVTVWGDLAELNYRDPAPRAGLNAYWSRFVTHCLELGFRGFRCDAAYKVPVETWQRILSTARSVRTDTHFYAETLGCRLEEVAAVATAGFDFLYNSSKWWDSRDPWCLDQYGSHRRIAPSISFPETHDTPRLAEEVDGSVELLRQRYLFAAFFSAGLMMPIGFEYGARRRLHVVETRPADREPIACDLTGFIGAVNAMKAATPVLNEEGPIDVIARNGPIVRLRKRSDLGAPPVVAWIHTEDGLAEAPCAEAEWALGTPREDLRVISPPSTPSEAERDPSDRLTEPLRAYEMRIIQIRG
jgi:starch synthase (maltosyl-transferring)